LRLSYKLSHCLMCLLQALAQRSLSGRNTLQALTWSAAGGAGIAFADQMRSVTSLEGVATIGMAAAGVATLASLPKLFKAARLMWRNGSLEGSLHEVALSVIDGLFASEQLDRAQYDQAEVEVRASVDGRREIIVTGVSRASERTIMQAIVEVLGPVQNPRYLLVRRSWLGRVTRHDYHAVPSCFGTHKEKAECFAQIWNRRIGSSDMHYTRNIEGRELLLKARMQSFAAGFQRSVDRRSAWL